MEDRAEYGKKRKIGEIPRTTRVEFAYQLTGSTMGLLGESNAMIAGVLNGESTDIMRVQALLQSVQELCQVIERVLRNETYDFESVPF